uniref:PvuIIW n=1 Tax=Proteus vulgaris TaxID=585 RepID=Q52623_PROVU|nr:PvuIIW [Proteus vulgaris]
MTRLILSSGNDSNSSNESPIYIDPLLVV